MRVRPLPIVATLAGAAITAAAFTVVAPIASAYTGNGTGAFTGAPSWVQTDSARKGSVLFYDGNGAQITGGSDIQTVGNAGGLFGYLAAKNGDGSVTNLGPGAGAVKVNAQLAAPDPTNANISTWATAPIPPTNARFSPIPGGIPAAVSANPAFLKLNDLGQAFQDVATGVVLYTGANAEYKNVFEIRLIDTVDTAHYWATDIEYNPTGAGSSYDGLAPGAWKVIWPAVVSDVATTTTTPTVAPTGASQTYGTSVTFSTTVAAASGSIASGGTVKFFYDGTHQIGATKNVSGPVGTTPVNVSSDAVTDIPVGAHSITAQFTPGGSGFATSTSASGLSFSVTGVATATTTPTATPVSPVTAGTGVKFSTTIAPASGTLTSGTVTFKSDGTSIGTKDWTGTATNGSPATVQSDSITSLTVGTHSITAEFTPGDAGYAASPASSGLSFEVDAAPADTTTTTLTTNPATTADSATDVTLTAVVADGSNATHPTGSVAFKDGATTLATVNLTAAANANESSAAFTILKSTIALGSHALSAVYTPSGNFQTSTGNAALTITLAGPSNVTAPSAAGAKVGVATLCNPGLWLNAGAFTYTWSQRLNSSAAWTQFATTQTSGVLPPTYAGHQIKCTVVAYSPAATGGTTPVDSATAVVAVGAPLKATKAPRILGTPKVGKRLSVSVGSWSPAATSYAYTWKVGSVIVSRSATWTPSKAYKGKYVTVTVTAKRAGYANGTATSGRVKIG